MPLPRTQWKVFADALLAAFPTRGDLRRLVSYGLGKNLDEISGDGLADLVHNLLVWADAQGRMDALVQAACAANPGNQALRVFCAEGEAGVTMPGAPDPARTEAGRQALLDSYLDQLQH